MSLSRGFRATPARSAPAYESKTDPSSYYFDRTGVRPQTELQALMETPPGADPVQSVEQYQEDEAYRSECLQIAFREALRDSELTGVELAVVVACLVDGMSYRDAAAQLGISKSEVHRITQRVLPRLREALAPVLKERYGTE